jgi:hypothetical protein
MGGKNIAEIIGVIILAACLGTTCKSVSKSTTTVSPALQKYEITSYMVFPFLSEGGTYAGDYPLVKDNGAEKITRLVRARLTEILPYVIDRYTTYTAIRDVESLLKDDGENYNELLRGVSDADALVVGKATDYNPSRVGFFIKCVHLRDEETLWTSEMEVDVSGTTLDIEKAADLAVEKMAEELENKLGL